MLNFSYSTFPAFLVLYVPSASIPQLKRAWRDPVPCKNFYDKGQKRAYNEDPREFRGGTNCWCPDEEKFVSHYYWYHSGENGAREFDTEARANFSWYQGDNFAQNWANCDLTASHLEKNVEWAARHCDSILKESGVNGWENSYDIKPSKKTASLDLDVNYAMRCEYLADVAV